MGTKTACNIDLPDQPMDCCFSSTDPVIASGLVTGQVMVHKYTAQHASGQTHDNQQNKRQEGSNPVDNTNGTEASGESYTATEVLCRDSKKGASCRAVSFTSDSCHLACGFETGTILQLDAATGKVAARLTKAHAASITRLLGIPQQPTLVASGDEDGGLCVWDLRSGSAAMKYSKHTDFISGLTLHEKQQALLAVSGDGTLSVHDLRSNKQLARSEDDADDELLSVVVVKHGKKVVCGSQSGVLAIWSWGYWNDCSDRFPGHPESVDAVVKFDEDTVITGSSDGALRVINILPNKLIGVVGEHEQDMPVERLALAADRQLLASISHTEAVKLWDLSILQEDGEEDEDEEQQEEAAAAAAVPAGQPSSSGLGAAAAAAAAAVEAAAAAGSSRRRPRAAAGSEDEASEDEAGEPDSSGDSSDEEHGSNKKRKKREKTAMSKGRNKPSKASNFFADLL